MQELRVAVIQCHTLFRIAVYDIARDRNILWVIPVIFKTFIIAVAEVGE